MVPLARILRILPPSQGIKVLQPLADPTALLLLLPANRLLRARCAIRPHRRPRPPLVVRRGASAQLSPLHGLAPPDSVRGEQSLHHTAVARRLLRRNAKWHCGEAAAGAGPDGEGACALRQRAEPSALPVEHIDWPMRPSASE